MWSSQGLSLKKRKKEIMQRNQSQDPDASTPILSTLAVVIVIILLCACSLVTWFHFWLELMEVLK